MKKEEDDLNEKKELLISTSDKKDKAQKIEIDEGETDNIIKELNNDE